MTAAAKAVHPGQQRTFSVVVDDRPLPAWLRASAGEKHVRIVVDPMVVDTGPLTVTVGFPLLEISPCVAEAEEVARHIVALLNDPPALRPPEPPSRGAIIDGSGVDGDGRITVVGTAATLALKDVILERNRQRDPDGENYRTEQDDTYRGGQLAAAAGCYALEAAGRTFAEHRPRDPAAPWWHDFRGVAAWPRPWPWSSTSWKPTTVRRCLVKAAALILAEIERLDRDSARMRDAAKHGDTAK